MNQLSPTIRYIQQRAILVLKRDLARAEAREEARKKKEAEEAAAKAAAEAAAAAAAAASLSQSSCMSRIWCSLKSVGTLCTPAALRDVES